jgi:hypothetical protein
MAKKYLMAVLQSVWTALAVFHQKGVGMQLLCTAREQR